MAMRPQPDFYTALNDKALSNYFRNAGDMLAEESAVLGAAVRGIISSGELLTNKSIILSLIHLLECTDDVVQSDVIRKTLEIVVGYTSDDM